MDATPANQPEQLARDFDVAEGAFVASRCREQMRFGSTVQLGMLSWPPF